MLSNPEDLFSVNKNSIEYILKTIIDQRQGFRPISKPALKELMNVELREIPFEGTITERDTFINETMDNLIKKYSEEGKLRIEKDPSDEEQDDSKDDQETN